MTISPFHHFLETLGKAIDSPLHADRQGVCMVELEKGVPSLLFEWDQSALPGTVLVSSDLGPGVPGEKAKRLETALCNNYEGRLILSYEPTDGHFFLHTRLPLEIAPRELSQAIEDFLRKLKEWERPHEEKSIDKPHGLFPFNKV